MDYHSIRLDYIDAYQLRLERRHSQPSFSVPSLHSDVLVVHLHGYLVLGTVDWVSDMLHQLVDHGWKYFVIDFSHVEFSMSGTAAVSSLASYVLHKGGQVEVAAASEVVRNTLAIIGLGAPGSIHSSVDDAVNTIVATETR